MKHSILRKTMLVGDRFYEMQQISDEEFITIYGNAYTEGTRKVYPMTRWDKIYRERIFMGFNDVTSAILK